MARTARKQNTAPSAEEVVEAAVQFFGLLSQYDGGAGATAEADEDDDDEGEDDDYEPPSVEDASDLSITELREVGKNLGVESKKKADILAAVEEWWEENGDDDGDDDDDDDEDDYDEWSLADLRKEVTSRIKSGDIEGVKAVAVKKMDQDELVELLRDSDGDEEDDDDDDDEGEEITEDDLRAMSLTELSDLAEEMELGLKLPKTAKTAKAKKDFYVNAILESAEEDDDE